MHFFMIFETTLLWQEIPLSLPLFQPWGGLVTAPEPWLWLTRATCQPLSHGEWPHTEGQTLPGHCTPCAVPWHLPPNAVSVVS